MSTYKVPIGRILCCKLIFHIYVLIIFIWEFVKAGIPS